jgi:methyl-accepting chemotaxis protein
MDQATQQNAALVEESAAAAESLRHQAQQLVDAVAVFKIAGVGQVLGQPAGHAGSAPHANVERRGPDRATNVSRPSFGAAAPAKASSFKAAPAPARVVAASPPVDVTPARTGTDDWESF